MVRTDMVNGDNRMVKEGQRYEVDVSSLTRKVNY